MQRVSALLPAWDKANRKTSLDKVRGWADKIPAATNRLSTGSHSYGPLPLERECDKAARILKSFCGDGFLATADDPPASPRTSSSGSTRGTLKKIPPRIIQSAVGLAIFSSMRSGTWISNSSGSGILLARRADGTWSPPSGIMVHPSGLGLAMHVDIYDCVLVINNFTVLELFTRPKLILGTDVKLTEGLTMAVGWSEFENDVRWADLSDTAYTYLKANGHVADVKLEGTVIAERSDENERFYWSRMPVTQILAGNVERDMSEIRPLTEMLKAAEGRTDYDVSIVEELSTRPAPGDSPLASPRSLSSVTQTSPTFGIPDVDDPDPFGVLALEMAGLEIREAGTRLRPASSQFEFNPGPSSPLGTKFPRQSVDTYNTRSNRGSYMSTKTERSRVSDAYTQTEQAETPDTTPSPTQSEDGKDRGISDAIPEVHEPQEMEPIEVDYTKIDMSSLAHINVSYQDLDGSTVTSTPELDEAQFRVVEMKATGTQSDLEPVEEDDSESLEGDMSDADDEDDFEVDDDEEPVIFEVATAQPPARVAMVASQGIQAKGGAAVVNIPKRIPPPLPIRSPRRSRLGQEFGDIKLNSPLRQEFGEVKVNSPLRQEFVEAESKSQVEEENISTPKVEAAGAFPTEEEIDVSTTTANSKNEAPTPEPAVIVSNTEESVGETITPEIENIVAEVKV